MYKRILAPLDTSELSELSLEHVKTVVMAGEKTEVILLVVLEPIPHLAHSAVVREEGYVDTVKDGQTQAQDYLDKIAERLTKEGIKAQGVVAWGRPADEILKYIEENNIDLVVMSTHGRSGISRWALGSVAEKVVRYSIAPVLIIPPHNFRSAEQHSQ